MTTRIRIKTLSSLTVVALMLIIQSAAAKEIPAQLPDPDAKPPVTNRPVKVYILSGQSNMVGIGQISGGSSRWGKQFSDPVVSIYPGKYSPTADYDKMTAIETKRLPAFGGVEPTPFPGGGAAVVRGFIKMPTAGVYKFNAGYSNSSYSIMEVDGGEVYRKEPGKESVHAEFKFTVGKKYPFKITFLTEAANGLGWVWRTDIPGTLDTVVKTDKKFPHLVDDQGNWTVRNDVWYKGVVTATANKWLTVGCGSGAGTIGPELQFGHIMGYYHDEPVIIIKASQGNRSLGWDILPPGSERFTFDGRMYAGYKDTPSSWIEGEEKKPVNWYAGKQYDDFVNGIHDVLDNFATHFPQYKDQGYEIAGFAWWQGHKDGNAAHASRYEQNLVHLIKTLRKEFKAPKAPFVIATIAFGGWKMAGPHLTVANAQLAVSGEKGKYPEFAGNVLTVETRDFWKEAEESPRNQDFHYNGNAETYINVGDALGRGMCRLLENTGKIHPASDPSNTGGWILKEDMSDEFEGERIDAAKWYVEGTDGKYKRWIGRAPSQFSSENVRVENGKLYITTKWDPDFDYSTEIKPEYKSPYEKYTTAAVLSNKTFLYGYMEIKCKAADASITSSFWTTGKGSELDVFEFVGDSKRADKDKKYPFATHDWSTGKVNANTWKDSVELDWRVADDFHVYGCKWSEDGLKFYADGRLVKAATRAELGKAWVLTQPLMIWVDSETFYWEGFPDEEDLPVDFEIEYIRVWQNK